MAKHKTPHPWRGQRFGAAERARPTPKPELFVEVVASATDEVVKRLGPFASAREAEKADNVVNINLNHERFYTRTTA